MSSMMEEFIQYAKEQFGYNISFDKSSMPDTFESLFGMSFMDQIEKFDFGENIENSRSYSNVIAKIKHLEKIYTEEIDWQQNLNLTMAA